MVANRLAGETSPYLLQHAHNPVDWYPWGPPALDRARALDRPIFLSIGYSACHWCHVMERESFEDPVTAAFLNEHFVAIKVDREERPDLDAVYMDAVQAITGSGGWPMSVFLAPDGRPFHGGTYFPKTRRHGMPSFLEVLGGVAGAWRARRTEVEASATSLAAHVARRTRVSDGDVGFDAALLDAAVAALEAGFDAEHGGWGSAPKFPQPMAIDFLLRRAAAGDARALPIARRALDRMAAGGIFDQLAGGFARYATDAAWLVPHFEKMLYDNAQLARVYVHAWALTGEAAYLRTATATLDFVAREMTLPDGVFAASLDADTGGEEGATYTWTADEVGDVLTAAGLAEAWPLFAEAYDVTEAGNWEGRVILRRVASDAGLADRHGRALAQVSDLLERARVALLAVRDRRPQPARDDKALAGWNGLMIGAFADAAALLPRDGDAGRGAAARYRALAERAADRLLGVLRAPDGRFLRSWKDGSARHVGTLEDQACMADGLLALFEATGDERWFTAASETADAILARFSDPAGGFHDTADDAEALVARPRSLQDNALPSGGAMAATVLLRLAALTGDGHHAQAAEAALRVVGDAPAAYPTAFAQWLAAIDWHVGPVDEIAIVADPADPLAERLAAVARGASGPVGWRPRQVIAMGAASSAAAVPLLQGRFALGGAPTAFVCRSFACRQPVTEPEALAAILGP
ncbi:MAG TPA: thioredoxin domain-containing protein [Patescibacteria group bacterium]|nr:thioredoxin domain-containing protein [Patescibacteria group bacterium]